MKFNLYKLLSQNVDPGGGTPIDPGGVLIENPLKYDSLNAFLAAIIDAIIKIGTPLLVLAFLVIGFRYITAQGNSQKIKDIHYQLLWTVVGAAVILGAAVIREVIQNTIDQVEAESFIQEINLS